MVDLSASRSLCVCCCFVVSVVCVVVVLSVVVCLLCYVCCSCVLFWYVILPCLQHNSFLSHYPCICSACCHRFLVLHRHITCLSSHPATRLYYRPAVVVMVLPCVALTFLCMCPFIATAGWQLIFIYNNPFATLSFDDRFHVVYCPLCKWFSITHVLFVCCPLCTWLLRIYVEAKAHGRRSAQHHQQRDIVAAGCITGRSPDTQYISPMMSRRAVAFENG